MKTHNSYQLSGNIVDIVKKRIFKGVIKVQNGKILNIIEKPVSADQYILPGLIDAHIHIESSMLIPSEFARLAVTHGTVATVSDPHEIANVLGIKGVKYMIENGKKVPFKFYFGASSCVPATPFETAGAELGIAELEELLQMDEVKYLSEMMNFPGVLFGDEHVKNKLNIAKRFNKPIDGHAPGLMGDDAEKYINAGITTDHECFTLEEGREKIKYGMIVQIREGSAAKNFEALIPLMKDYADMVMLCSDDRHPNDLVKQHINDHIKRAIKYGIDPIEVIRSCIYNPVKHYNLDVGMLQEGDSADMIIVDNLEVFNVLSTYINGIKVAENGKSLIEPVQESAPNYFNATAITIADLEVPAEEGKIKVQQALDGQLITRCIIADPKVENGKVVSDTSRDILKMVVLNRYKPAKPSIDFVNNFGFKQGAIASTVAHDSHNIIAVGTNDMDIVNAINLVIEHRGGVSLANGEEKHILPLPVAGLMSNEDGYIIAEKYDFLDKKAKKMGSGLGAPYMTLSFMALLVIPDIKLSDKGLFDGKKFEFTHLFDK